MFDVQYPQADSMYTLMHLGNQSGHVSSDL
jgi:hypothetical protein